MSNDKLCRSIFIGATPKDAMKLRMTGFECSPTFVIRLGLKASSEEDGARHRTTKLVSVFHI